jgi:hypothetical protein
MGALVGVGLGLIAGFAALLVVGRAALGFLGEKRIRDWARSKGYVLERCERTLNLAAGARLTWRVRLTDETGEKREAWVRGGGSEPLDVLWAAPGESIFR